MKHRSPFALDRFEQPGPSSYFLHHDIYQEVVRDAPKTIYLIGPRGTGKTTLLKALHWRERQDNASLRLALQPDVFNGPAGRFLGVYLKLPEILLEVIENWVKGLDPVLAGPIVALYLDLVWIESACSAVAELLALGVFRTPTAVERRAVKEISDRYSGALTRGGRRAPRTVSELGAAILDLRKEIEGLAKTQQPHYTVLMYDAVDQIGAFGRFVGGALEPLCRTDDSTDPWHFRICMDEGETLSEFQLLVVNSMVRVARAPVVFVVSFVSMPGEVHRTLFKDLTLQVTDREIVSFDTLITRQRFREFAEGVTTVRLRQLLEGTHFDVYKSLGRLDINAILERILDRSVAPYAKWLRERAAILAKDPRFVAAASDSHANPVSIMDLDDLPLEPLEQPDDLDSGESDALPIYQAFLISELKLPLPAVDEPWQRRRQSSAELRKRMVAAYLAICGRLSTEPRYASANMVLGLSDLCIRDFLRFVNSIYQQFEGDLSDFIRGPVGVETQDYAIKEASRGKAQGVAESGVSSPREIEMIFRGVGRVTRMLQTRSPNQQHLLSSERGLFALPLHDLSSNRINEAYRQLREAAEAGYLRVTHLSRDEIRFRLHASLAPAFGLSYRGAYYRSPVTWTDIELLRHAKSDTEVDALAERIGRRFSDDETLSLFPELNNE